MSSIDINLVEQLNNKAKMLNNRRQQMVGAKEAASQAYKKAVFAYEQKHGVTLDDTNLQQEYNSALAEIQAEFDRVNALVTSIESGEYKNNQVASQSQPSVQPTQGYPNFNQQPQSPQVNQFAQPQFTQPVQQQPVQPQVQQPVAQPQFQQQAEPVTQEAVTPPPSANLTGDALQRILQASQNQKPAETPLSALQGNEAQQAQQPTNTGGQGFTPQGWGAPNKALDQQFATILGQDNKF